jgi:hypothetical protein
MRFKSGDPLEFFLYKTAILDVKKYLKKKINFKHFRKYILIIV